MTKLLARMTALLVLLFLAAAMAVVAPQPAHADQKQLVYWQRLSGGTALDTMGSIVDRGWSNSGVAVLATNANFPDALAASSLAGQYNAPVLMTEPSVLSERTRGILNRFRVKTVYVVGGKYAVSDKVLSQLKDMGISVERLRGNQADDTAVAIAKKLTKPSATCFVATEANYADALSASPYAYATSSPVFLTRNRGTALSADTVAAIRAGGYSHIIVVGGRFAVSDAVLNQLRGICPNTERISGITAVDTSIKLAEWQTKNGMRYTNCGFATDKNYPDALAGAALCGKHLGVLMLVNDAEVGKVTAVTSAHKCVIGEANVFGGRFAVSYKVYSALSDSTKGQQDCGNNSGGGSGGNGTGADNGSGGSSDNGGSGGGGSDNGSGATQENTVTVTFEDGLGNVLKKDVIPMGGTATPPADPIRDGYAFSGWDRGYSYIYRDTTVTATWVLIELLRLLDSSTLDPDHPVGMYFRLDTNNKIAKVEVLDRRLIKDVTSLVDYNSGCETYLVPEEIGVFTVVLTDIYGQTVSYTSNSVLNEYSKELNASRYDESLAPPTIARADNARDYCSVDCPGTFPRSDGATGYQMYMCNDPAFPSTFDNDWCDYEWNSTGFVKLSLFYPHFGKTRYIKVRAYRVEGSTMVYGPWSSVSSFEVPNFSNQRSGGTQYSYEVYFVNDGLSKTYNSGSRVLFVKTDNPDPSTMKLAHNGSSFFNTTYGNWEPNDIAFHSSADYGEFWRKVEGGYVAKAAFEDAGTFAVDLLEANSEGYVVAKALTFNVADYWTVYNAWMDGIIAKVTTSAMNPKEKMDAVSAYLVSGEAGFRYVTNANGRLVDLVMQPNTPSFETKRWDSYLSPAALCNFAERIGGFEEIHNCYYDSGSWSTMHSYARVTYAGQQYYYSVCPYTESSNIGSFEMVNFSNSSHLIPVG